MIRLLQMIRRGLASPKQKLKNYKFPEVRKEDCEQKYISGWGPGGQKVNTAQNAVQLTHKPTGTVLKVHESRLLPKNIDIAFERMKFALDRQINGENCYEEQLKRLEKAKEEKANRKREKAREEKESMGKPLPSKEERKAELNKALEHYFEERWKHCGSPPNNAELTANLDKLFKEYIK